MMTMPGASCAPATSAISASLTTSTRAPGQMSCAMARIARSSSSRSDAGDADADGGWCDVAIADRSRDDVTQCRGNAGLAGDVEIRPGPACSART
jgi:hypothetical protein